MAAQEQADLGALSDLCTPWSVHVAATLRIADHIAAGITEIGELAAASGSHTDSLHRLLRHLVAKGVFEEPAPGRFALNEPARGLLDTSGRIGFDIEGFGGRMDVCVGQPARGRADRRTGLSHGLRSTVLGGPPGPSGNRRELRRADGSGRAWHSRPGGAGQRRLGIGEHRGRRRRRDGIAPGGDPPEPGPRSGARWSTSLRQVARSAETFEVAGVADRVNAVGQSFFDPLPAGADLYLLKSVLADWPDREALALLRRCAEAARPSGRVVVLGGVSPDEGGIPSPALLMMVLVGAKTGAWRISAIWLAWPGWR